MLMKSLAQYHSVIQAIFQLAWCDSVTVKALAQSAYLRLCALRVAFLPAIRNQTYHREAGADQL